MLLFVDEFFIGPLELPFQFQIEGTVKRKALFHGYDLHQATFSSGTGGHGEKIEYLDFLGTFRQQGLDCIHFLRRKISSCSDRQVGPKQKFGFFANLSF